MGDRVMAEFKDLYEQPTEISYRFNDFAFWYPLLKRIGMRTPKSNIIHTDIELVGLLEGEMPDGYSTFLCSLWEAVVRMGLPCILRTGQLSNKHGWEGSCYLDDVKKLSAHVGDLVETSCMANIAGKPFPYSTWVVRELIPTIPLFYAFYGKMPITREFRFFIQAGKVQCYHPYWPAEAFENQPDDDWKTHIDTLQAISDDDLKELTLMADYVAGYFEGYWSVDFLQASDGKWWLIDVALGSNSYHWRDCKFNT